jgi:hypothetical protein
MKKFILITLLCALTVFACNDKDDDDDPCTCPIKAHLAQGQTCDCGGKDCNCTVAEPIDKTYTITFKDGALVFTVEYIALPNEEPAYLTYIKERLEVVANSEQNTSVTAVNNLITNGGSNHTITVEYTNTVYEGIKWNATSRTFTIHNDWITTATGTDLSAAMIRNAFIAVEAE